MPIKRSLAFPGRRKLSLLCRNHTWVGDSCLASADSIDGVGEMAVTSSLLTGTPRKKSSLRQRRVQKTQLGFSPFFPLLLLFKVAGGKKGRLSVCLWAPQYAFWQEENSYLRFRKRGFVYIQKVFVLFLSCSAEEFSIGHVSCFVLERYTFQKTTYGRGTYPEMAWKLQGWRVKTYYFGLLRNGTDKDLDKLLLEKYKRRRDCHAL